MTYDRMKLGWKYQNFEETTKVIEFWSHTSKLKPTKALSAFSIEGIEKLF